MLTKMLHCTINSLLITIQEMQMMPTYLDPTWFKNSQKYSDHPMVKLFQTEYSRDYNNAIRSGITITPKFVQDFINHK